MQSKSLALAAVLTAGLAAQAHAGMVLGSFTADFGGTFPGEITEATIEVMMETDIFSAPGIIQIDSPALVNAGDVGMTWSTDATNIGPILSQLGDADPFDGIGFSITADTFLGPQGAGQALVEFGFGSFGLDPIALSSQTSQIVATLVDLTFAESPLSDHSVPNGEGIITDYTVGVQFEFIGVPSPATASLLAIAGISATRRRRGH